MASNFLYFFVYLHGAPILDGILPDEYVRHAAPGAAAAPEQARVDLGGDSGAVRFVVAIRLEHHLQGRARVMSVREVLEQAFALSTTADPVMCRDVTEIEAGIFNTRPSLTQLMPTIQNWTG